MRWWRRPWAGRRPEPGSTVAELARTAVSASAADATLDLTRITDAYAAWAHDRGTAGELAEAQFMRALSVAREAQRRVLSEDRQRLLARTEAVAAEAAYHSGLEGRGREAVVVLEQARAIVVARLLGAVHPRTAAALRAAGRERLLAEYLAAVRRRADAYRRSGGGASHGDRAGGQSALGSAQAAVVRLTRQMATQAGYTPAAGATFAAVQLAAARTPLLYVAAAEAGGYALLVRAAGDPWFVPLPELSLRRDQARQLALILHSSSGSELLHHPLLLFAQLLRRFDLHFDNQIAALISLVHSLPSHAESLSRCSSLRNLDEHFFSVERRYAHLRAKRRLRDVDRNRRDHIEPFALVELVRQNGKRDQQDHRAVRCRSLFRPAPSVGSSTRYPRRAEP